MKIGEIIPLKGDIELNANRQVVQLKVENKGTRPIQIGSHYHFYEANDHLSFDRQASFGYRLDIPAGTAIRFQPGEVKTVDLVEIAGKQKVFGMTGKVNGYIKETNIKTKKDRGL